jgi:hypothetical protein
MGGFQRERERKKKHEHYYMCIYMFAVCSAHFFSANDPPNHNNMCGEAAQSPMKRMAAARCSPLAAKEGCGLVYVTVLRSAFHW